MAVVAAAGVKVAAAAKAVAAATAAAAAAVATGAFAARTAPARAAAAIAAATDPFRLEGRLLREPFSCLRRHYPPTRRLRGWPAKARSSSAFGSTRSSFAAMPICQGITR